MQLVLDRIEVDGAGSLPLSGSWSAHEGLRGVAAGLKGPEAITGLVDGEGQRLGWWISVDDGRPRTIRSARLVLRVEGSRGDLRMLRHGYQSWSACDVAVFGRHSDPSRVPGTSELIRGAHHADQRVVAGPEELRSEWFTVLVDDGDRPTLIGFEQGVDHDGTLRLRNGPHGPELLVEAFLGDARFEPDARLDLHEVLILDGLSATGLLAEFARLAGGIGRARAGAPFTVGWCSWYQYFHDLTEVHLVDNLVRSASWPIDVFQIDDGYQAAIGDWTATNDRFTSSLDRLAARIVAEGRRPGLWLAPFLAAPDSDLVRRHPEWLACDHAGEPLIPIINPPWGGGRNGAMFALDTTRPDVQEHLERLAAQLVASGFGYLKLDFTFAPSFDGRWSDPAATPAQRVRAGFEAIRRGAGEDAFLLGCGAPLAQGVGIVDAMRIGPDVAPSWNVPHGIEPLAGYGATQPSVRNAWVDTAVRAFMHRRLWVNDPDCVMLRTEDTTLDVDRARTWSRAVGVSGGMVMLSDDLALLSASARSMLDETIETARRADEAARAGRVARSPGLLKSSVPTVLESPVGRLEVEVGEGTSVLLPSISFDDR